MTYSIVARDGRTGEMGVAVQSHYFSVGSVVTWARAGVGAVATQSIVEPSYGPLGLELMGGGKSAIEALSALVKADRSPDGRQVGMVDSKGQVGAHTGPKCIPHAGHIIGKGFSCQANLMRNEKVWGAMHDEYLAGNDLPLAERLVESLEAGERAGGDARGRQSSALLVVGKAASANPWSGRVVELRVEDDPEPVAELRRLLRYRRGYDWVDKGDALMASHRSKAAGKAYAKGLELVPEVEELRYWVGLSLLGTRERSKGVKMVRDVTSKHKGWAEVTKGVSSIGMVKIDRKLLKRLTDL